MQRKNTILDPPFYANGGGYTTKEALLESGAIPLDDKQLFYGRIEKDGSLVIWRTFGEPKPEEDDGCFFLYLSRTWSPEDAYLNPLKKKLEEMLEEWRKRD